MNRSPLLPLLALALALSSSTARAVVASHPPRADAAPVTDDYFGRKITDPYRWMEAEPQPAFDAYLHGQNDYARAMLARIPGRKALGEAIGAVSGLTPRASDVELAGGRIFYLKRDAGGQIDKLFVRDAAGRETLLVDPSRLDRDGKHAEIDQFSPSFDGSLVAYGISVGGSENSTLHVLETATGTIRPDTLDRAQFAGVSWAPDGHSFFFDRLPLSSLTAKAVDRYAHQIVYRHVLGTDPATDSVVLDGDHLPFPFQSPATFPSVASTPGSQWVIASAADGVSPEVAFAVARLSDVLAGHPAWKQLAGQSDDIVAAVVRGDRIDLLTHKNAPHFRIIETALAAPDLAHATAVVAEQAGVLTGLAAASDALYYAERDGAAFSLHRIANGGAATTVALPYAGTIAPGEEGPGGLVATPDAPGALVSLVSWVRPNAWFRYDPAAGTLTDTSILPPFPRDLSGYQSRETTVTARDGTRVPLSIVSKRGLARDGRRPTYLVGYGSYGISYDPAFSPDFLPWLDRGGIYAVAHVRGGGELGQAWHDGGKILTKQNTIHDFIDAAEALVRQGYTDPAHLAGEGTSAGGILIGGAITQRPDLFRAALIRVGATNTIREEYTAGGPANIPEFGTVKDKAQFPAMLAMDAYNHVRKGVAYPAVLLTGGADDPRVTVWIPAKMTARLQADSASGRPVLLRVEFDAGHGIGSTRKQRDDETADELAFLLWQFGEAGFQPAR